MEDAVTITTLGTACSPSFTLHVPHVCLCCIKDTECIVALPLRGIMESNTSVWSRPVERLGPRWTSVAGLRTCVVLFNFLPHHDLPPRLFIRLCQHRHAMLAAGWSAHYPPLSTVDPWHNLTNKIQPPWQILRTVQAYGFIITDRVCRSFATRNIRTESIRRTNETVYS